MTVDPPCRRLSYCCLSAEFFQFSRARQTAALQLAVKPAAKRTDPAIPLTAALAHQPERERVGEREVEGAHEPARANVVVDERTQSQCDAMTCQRRFDRELGAVEDQPRGKLP